MNSVCEVTDYAALVAAAGSQHERVELTAEWIGSVLRATASSMR